jgi:hypothetical protein
MAETPTLRALRRLERAVGEPLERAIDSPSGADALAAVTRVARAGAGALEWVRGAVLHAGGLPTQHEIARLGTRVACIEQLLEEIAHRLDDAHD